MEPKALLAEAQKGGFFSYAAGVAYQVLTHYRVRGLEIDNYRTDLPVKKGLSSSAAICVLMARAFNRVYDLKMTVRGEMELAYQGEITTPSRCGRMDQGCAFGNRPVLMAFDGDRLERRGGPAGRRPALRHRRPAREQGHAGDPEPAEPLLPLRRRATLERGVQEYLGPINQRIVGEAAGGARAGRRATAGRAHDRGAGRVRPLRRAGLPVAADRARPAPRARARAARARTSGAARAWARRATAPPSSSRAARSDSRR